MKPTFYMLVGLPGTGKTTWTDWYRRANKEIMLYEAGKTGNPPEPNLTVISTDAIIENIGREYRLTYNQVFDPDTYKFAETLSFKLAKIAFERNDNVVWDQTNLTIKSRARKLALVPAHYTKVAVMFISPGDLEDRLASRPGKVIPSHVLDTMRNTYQPPELSEGFDEILVR